MCASWAEERGRGTPGIRAQLRLKRSRQWKSGARGWNSVRQRREQGVTPRERARVSPRRGFFSLGSEESLVFWRRGLGGVSW